MNTTIKLDGRNTRLLLEAAVRTHAQVVLQSSDWGEATLNGYLITGDEQALLIEITGQPPLQEASLLDATCEVHLYADQRYVFAATITSAPRWGHSRSIAVTRPNAMGVMDRRRYTRAKLAPSSMVKLEWTRERLARRYSAPLLNISPDGLACRLDGPVAESIDVGNVLITRFHLPYQDHAFGLEGTVVNKTLTPEGRVILGLRFTNSQRFIEELTLLRSALSGKAPAVLETEVFA